MQWLAETCVKRPVFAVMIIAAMVVAGATAYQQLGVARYPKIDMPTLYVYTQYPGASPTEMESEIRYATEGLRLITINSVKCGVRYLKSKSFS